MATYTVSRSTTIVALPGYVHAKIADLRAWQEWSPREGLDPDLDRTHSGPDAGAGQRYVWSGNKKAGSGSMEILSDEPQTVHIAVNFLKPFTSSSISTFTLEGHGESTDVTWTMEGQQNALLGLIGRFYPMDKMIGPDFEKGLARLKQAVEAEKR